MGFIPQRDIDVHEIGIRYMLEFFPNLQRTTTPDKVTFFSNANGARVRLKVDTYDFVNIFIETHSSIEGEVIGGPWQAANDGCDIYAYYYPRAGQVVLTHLGPEAMTVLGGLSMVYADRGRIVKNRGYNTRGILLHVNDYLSFMRGFCAVRTVEPKSI